MKQVNKRILLVSILLMVLLPVPILLYTETGLNMLFQIAVSNVPGKLEASGLQGTVGEKITFETLRYRDEEFDISLTKGSLLWQPAKLFHGLLRIDKLSLAGIRINSLQAQKQVTQKSDSQLPTIKFPIRFDIESIHLQKIQYVDNNIEVLKLNTLSFGVYSQKGYLMIPGLFADMDDYNIRVNGKIKPQENYPAQLHTTFKINELFAQTFVVKAELDGDLRRLNTRAEISGFVNGSVRGDLLDVNNDLHWDAKAVVDKLSLKSFADNLPPNNITGNFTSQGNLDTMKFIGQASSSYTEWGDVTTSYDLVLAGNQLTFNEFNIREKQQPASLAGQGAINWGGEDVTYKLVANWQDLNWPWREPAQYASPTGKLSFQGTLSDYALTTEGNLAITNYPALKFLTSATGNLQQLNIGKLEIDALEGKALATGMVNWQNGLDYHAEFDFQQLNPGLLASDWPGKINASVSTSGQLINDQFTSKLSLSNLNGELHDKPLSGSADISIKNGEFDIEQLNLNVADSTHLKLHGKFNDTINIEYEFQSDDLAALQPEASGQLQATGTLRGPRAEPQIILDLKGQKLKYNDYTVGAIESKANVALTPDNISNIKLNVQNIQFENNIINTVNLLIMGTTDKHGFSLEVQKGENYANWHLTGSLQDKKWQGQLVDSLLKVEYLGELRLAKMSNVNLDENHLILEKNCYKQKTMSLCFQTSYQLDKAIANFDWHNLPITPFVPWLPADIRAETQFDGKAQLIKQKKDLLISAETSNTAGAVWLMVDDVEHQFPFKAGKTTLNWNPQELKFNLQLPLDNKAKISSQFTIVTNDPTLSLQQQPLHSELILQIPSLIVLAPFVPELKNLEQANLSAQLKVTGSLSQPKVNGFADISAPQLLVPELNVKLNKVSIHAESKDQNQIKFTGSVESGDGKIQVNGDLKQLEDNSWAGNSSVQGERFLAVDLPQAMVELSPRLNVNLQLHKITVDGDLLIPYARLKPKTLPVSAVSESPDVIIIGDKTITEAAGSRWQIASKVRVILGDRVSIDGFGLRSQLAGSLQLIDEANAVTVGRGEINLVEGRYRAYGQDLKINKGRFTFANTPVDDPGLDIVAQRQVGDVIAGIKVSSTLRKPEVRLFSEPTMAETDALSYLLLGRPLRQVNQSEGSTLMTAATAMGLAGSELLARSIGNRLGIDEILIETDSESQTSSLVIGRYLSPKLYIRYLTGIFERSNIVQLRYDVTKKIILQTETGTQMGADVFYTIEH